MTENLPDYEILSAQIESAGLEYTLAEIHGITSGILCSMTADFPALWQGAIFADTDANDVLVGEVRAALDQMAAYTNAQLEANELSLLLMLPADDAPIALRASAVRDWSQGFLYGFGLAGKQERHLFTADAGETLRDLVEISRMDTGQLEEVEQDEEALTELSEYLWVAALMIRQDVQSQAAKA